MVGVVSYATVTTSLKEAAEVWLEEFPMQLLPRPLRRLQLFGWRSFLCNCYHVLEGGCSCLVGGVSYATVTTSLKEAAAVWLEEFSMQLLPRP